MISEKTAFKREAMMLFFLWKFIIKNKFVKMVWYHMLMKELFDKYKNYEDKKLVLLLLTDINCIIKKKYSEYL